MQSNQNNKNGRIESYIHSNGRIGVLLELFCQTDFAGRTTEFRELAHDLAMQIAAMGKKDLLKQRYIRNLEMSVNDIVQEKAGKLGEEIKIGRIARFRL